MIYLEEKFNILPATPATLDKFIEIAEQKLVPICENLGARLIGAWYSNSEWMSQVLQVMEFDDFEALKRFRINSSQNSVWGEYMAYLEEFAPERKTRLLEPLGPIPPKRLQRAIESSQKNPNKVYSIATLEVASDKMSEFKELIFNSFGSGRNSPIIACWRPIGGSPNEVNDLWKTAIREEAYRPADKDFDERFFRPLREFAPKERIINLSALPYSPLK
ncbi:MAG: NIPSNAP family protein [Candidatus Thorarchaeota archaeon]